MERQAVISSNLVSVGYDRNTSTLEVEFRSGMYQYYGVPHDIYEGLMNASSIGSYHHQNIKNSFTCSKV
ncbi:KTSC domain-containing protein [Shewanella sp. SR44-3]|uniref:KTSC domain-containing protein n=1 Tax=Shewanella sp. SR44-3 TaxID=2760936 RepID=UPI0015F8B902|nr:KTSC domain-containing protein [Shewanella sp. SR44-3]MBB1268634.1 KTSC domain-containing protein [Shewanella sp. SR44-3]